MNDMHNGDSTTYKITLNGREYPLAADTDLARHLDDMRHCDVADLWIERGSGGGLVLLTNHDRAWLMYTRYVGDTGFHSVNPSYAGPDDETIEYYWYDGRKAEYPASWSISTDDALRAVEYFFAEGMHAPWIEWRDSTDGDQATG
jgi:hypothetical protein